MIIVFGGKQGRETQKAAGFFSLLKIRLLVSKCGSLKHEALVGIVSLQEFDQTPSTTIPKVF